MFNISFRLLFTTCTMRIINNWTESAVKSQPTNLYGEVVDAAGELFVADVVVVIFGGA